MSKEKQIRTCIVCRNKFSKQLINRLVLENNNEFIIDLKQIYNGRGYYLCNNLDCLQKIKKK